MHPIEPDLKPQGCSSCSRTQQYQQDFPIEWDGDHYVSRREMVIFGIGALLGAFVTFVGAILAFTHRK